MKKQYVTYARVSSQEQAERGNIRTQRQALRMLADRRDGEEWTCALAAEDDGLSGAYGEDQRPGWAQVLDAIRSGGVRELRVWRVDRLSRELDWSSLGAIVELMRRHRCNIVLADGREIRLSDQADDLSAMLLIYELRGAARERDRILKRTHAGRLRRALEGHPTVPPPYGYRFDRADGFVIQQDEAHVIRRVFELSADHSMDEVCAVLTAEGHTPPGHATAQRAGHPRRWSVPTLRKWMANTTFKGELRQQLIAPQDDQGKAVSIPPSHRAHVRVVPGRPTHWEVLVRVPAIVDEETWDAARRATRRRTKRPKRPAYEAMLRGHLWCGFCGRPVHARRRSPKKDTWMVPSYVCSGHKRGMAMEGTDRRCPARKDWPVADVDAQARAFLRNSYRSRSWLGECFTAFAELFPEQPPKEIDAALARRVAKHALRRRGDAPPTVASKLPELQAQLKALDTEYGELLERRSRVRSATARSRLDARTTDVESRMARLEEELEAARQLESRGHLNEEAQRLEPPESDRVDVWQRYLAHVEAGGTRLYLHADGSLGRSSECEWEALDPGVRAWVEGQLPAALRQAGAP